jgi:hypothetical protein
MRCGRLVDGDSKVAHSQHCIDSVRDEYLLFR